MQPGAANTAANDSATQTPVLRQCGPCERVRPATRHASGSLACRVASVRSGGRADHIVTLIKHHAVAIDRSHECAFVNKSREANTFRLFKEVLPCLAY